MTALIRYILTFIKFSVFWLLLGVGAISAAPAFAAGSATISVSPATGSYQVGQAFSVNLSVNGGGSNFNAVAADVTLSPNLSVQSITPGDCSFTLVRPYSPANPSFAGAVLTGFSQGCTVYTMNVVAKSKGTGTIALSKGSVEVPTGKTPTDVAELLSSMKGGSYTITGSALNYPSGSAAPVSAYTLQVQVVDANNTPVPGVPVLLLLQKDSIQSATGTNGIATFNSLARGVYSLTSSFRGEKINQNVMVDGSNPVVTAQVKLQQVVAANTPQPTSAPAVQVASNNSKIGLALGALILLVVLLIVYTIVRANKRI